MEGIFFRNHFTKHGLFLSFWVFCWLDLACAWCDNLLPHTITNSLKKVFKFINKVPQNGRKSCAMVFFKHIGGESKALFYRFCHHFKIYNFIANMQQSLQNCGREALEVFLTFLVENCKKKSWKRVNHFYQDHNFCFFLIKDFHFSLQIGRSLQKKQ